MACPLAIAMTEEEEDAIREANLDFVNRWHATNAAMAETAGHLHALPRVLVNTSNKTVAFYAEATGIGERDPIEFLLIGEQSGNAYEAIAVALANPKDIDDGLQMIGLPKGRSTNPSRTQFWPKGERVIMTFDGERAEIFLQDTRSGKTLPTRGLVYTGSQQGFTQAGDPIIAAQIRAPFAIAANYNEPDAILDVPWQAPQTAVYQHQGHNPELLMKGGKLIKVEITPEYTDGKRRVQDINLTLLQDNEISPGLAGARFTLENITGGKHLLQDAALDHLTAVFADMIAGGYDPFVELHFSDAVPLKTVREVASMLRAVDSENGIRIEAPPEGTLFYQAFTPNETFRERSERFIHPWEFHLDEETNAFLVRIDEHWTRGEPKPSITTTNIPVSNVEEMLDVLSTQRTEIKGIYVFAPGSKSIGALMEWLRPALPTHPHIHVYLQPPPQSLKRPL